MAPEHPAAHYFVSDPTLPERPRRIDVELRGRHVQVGTAAGRSLEVQVFDGTGGVRLLFFGRTSIAGIEPGKPLNFTTGAQVIAQYGLEACADVDLVAMVVPPQREGGQKQFVKAPVQECDRTDSHFQLQRHTREAYALCDKRCDWDNKLVSIYINSERYKK